MISKSLESAIITHNPFWMSPLKKTSVLEGDFSNQRVCIHSEKHWLIHAKNENTSKDLGKTTKTRVPHVHANSNM